MSKKEGMTSIWVSTKTRDRINALKIPGDRAEHVLRRVLTEYEKNHPDEIK